MIRHCAAFLSDQDVAHLFDAINKMLGRDYLSFRVHGKDADIRTLPHETFFRASFPPAIPSMR